VIRWTYRALLALGCLFGASAGVAADSAAAARNNYMLRCMGCHVADGSGSPGRVPSVRDSLAPLVSSAAGRRYLVQVPGAAQSPLSDLELAQVLSWMVRNLSRQAAPAGFVDFSAAEVASYRRAPLTDVQGTRARLLPSASSGRG
jgi:mono/diheme cytochrome c family protein